MFLPKGLITQINPDETLMCLGDINGHTQILFLVINKEHQASPSSPVCLITSINHTESKHIHILTIRQTDCCNDAAASSAGVNVLYSYNRAYNCADRTPVPCDGRSCSELLP